MNHNGHGEIFNFVAHTQEFNTLFQIAGYDAAYLSRAVT
jgi:hypothetical protein